MWPFLPLSLFRPVPRHAQAGDSCGRSDGGSQVSLGQRGEGWRGGWNRGVWVELGCRGGLEQSMERAWNALHRGYTSDFSGLVLTSVEWEPWPSSSL